MRCAQRGSKNRPPFLSYRSSNKNTFAWHDRFSDASHTGRVPWPTHSRNKHITRFDHVTLPDRWRDKPAFASTKKDGVNICYTDRIHLDFLPTEVRKDGALTNRP